MKIKQWTSESKYQSYLKNEALPKRFPGCFVSKQIPPPSGIPDLVVFYKGRYAWLEVKKSEKDYNKEFTKNQDYYISKAKQDGAFASFIYPEIEEEVLNEMEQSFSN